MLSAFQRIFVGDVPPNKVMEIKSEYLGALNVVHRDGAMVLFAPSINQESKNNSYLIVLQRPYSDWYQKCFSLYRSPIRDEAEERFYAFMHRLPVLIDIINTPYNADTLQTYCDTLWENQSWSIGHIIAHFNLLKCVEHPKVLDTINYPDHINMITPFQLAVKGGHTKMVESLLPNSDIDHLDKNGNSVFHYAANTSAKMIKMISGKSANNLNKRNGDGYTPLHLACLYNKPDCVMAFLLAGADVNILTTEHIDKLPRSTKPSQLDGYFVGNSSSKLATEEMKYGGTPLHWSSSREVLQALIVRGCDINALNFLGQTPLHVMVARNRFECVVALLAHDAEIDFVDKNGNTPLHIAIEKKLVPIVQCLVIFGCDIHIENAAGVTPRHMVGMEANAGKDCEILYILHSVGAKRCPKAMTSCPSGCHSDGTYDGIPPEIPEGGETREHIQNMLASSSSVGLFGTTVKHSGAEESASANTENIRKGQSVMDTLLAHFFPPKVAAKSPKKEDLSPSNSSDDVGSNGASTSSSTSSSQRKFGGAHGRLLCLDGGGIRGLVLIQMLYEIERFAQTPILHMFDWVAGTSTGGILALGLACGRTTRECLGLYFRMKEMCFVGSRPYPSALFETILKENLGEFNIMSDIKHPKVMITGVLADLKPVDLHLFRNYTSASEILNIVTPINSRRVPPPPPDNQLVWHVARATGAAPSYFRAFGRFLDGGLIANNPTLDAMTEIHEYNMALQNVGRDKEAIPMSVVISLGTGLIPVVELKDIDVFRPDSLWDTARVAMGISTLGNLLVDQATASDGRVVDRARAWCSMIGVPYFRFNPQLTEDIAMDEKDDLKLVNMLWHTKAYMYSNRNKIMEMLNFLK